MCRTRSYDRPFTLSWDVVNLSFCKTVNPAECKGPILAPCPTHVSTRTFAVGKYFYIYILKLRVDNSRSMYFGCRMWTLLASSSNGKITSNIPHAPIINHHDAAIAIRIPERISLTSAVRNSNLAWKK